MADPSDMSGFDGEPEADTTRIAPRTASNYTSAPPPSEPPPDSDDATVPPASTPSRINAPPAAPIKAKVSTPSGRMMPGQVLGHTYEIEALLARGGMGEVYRARHIELGSLHAIKVILPELAEDPKIISLFQEEARKLSRLRNDGIVAYEGLFRDENGVRYLVMEFVDGTSLSKIIRNGPLSVEAVRQLRDRCAMGLAAAHDKGIFHRDIAPDNILLVGDRPELAKIIDFGIAKSSDPGDKTIIGQDFAGKYSYVSPEQLGLHGGKVDGRSDIYSLGLVLVAAAAGRALDMGNSMISVIEARRGVPNLSSVPEALRAELAPLLEPDPADRPQSMRELPGGSSAGAPGSTRPAEATKPNARTAQPDKLSQSETGAGGKKGVAIAAGIIAFLLVVGGGAFFLFGNRPAPSTVASTPSAESPQLQTPNPVSPPPIPPPAAPPPQTVSLAAVQAALAQFPCASIRPTITGDGNVTMTGFVGTDADLRRLAPTAQSVGAVSATTTSVRVYQPLCEFAKLFDDDPRLAGTPRTVIDFNDSSRLYHDGARLVVTLTTGAVGGYLYVDYFDGGGTVVHMLPTPSVPHNQLASDQSVTLGTQNEQPKSNEDLYTVGAPYGSSMIVATITTKPIFARLRPQQENAADYLKELKHRLFLDSPGAASPLVAGGYEIFDVEP